MQARLQGSCDTASPVFLAPGEAGRRGSMPDDDSLSPRYHESQSERSYSAPSSPCMPECGADGGKAGCPDDGFFALSFDEYESIGGATIHALAVASPLPQSEAAQAAVGSGAIKHTPARSNIILPWSEVHAPDCDGDRNCTWYYVSEGEEECI